MRFRGPFPALAAAAACLLALLIAAWPGRRSSAVHEEASLPAFPSLLPYVETALRADPASLFGLSAPALEAEDGVVMLEGWATRMPAPNAGLAAWLAWAARRAPRTVSTSPPTSPLGLTAPAGLGEEGLAALRIVQENLNRLDPPVRVALEGLVGAVERAADAVRSGHVDRTAAALELAGEVDRFVDEWRAAERRGGFERLLPLPGSSGRVPRRLAVLGECSAGGVLVGGPGDTVLPLAGVAVAIDVGGNDRWLGGAGLLGPVAAPPPPVRVLVDFGGDDRYEGSGLAAADEGVSFLLDLAGHDRYEGGGFALGAVRKGVAVLFDRAGRDRYRVAERGLAHAREGGLALVVDAGGDDRYTFGSASVAWSEGGGRAAFVDVRGADLYLGVQGAEGTLAATRGGLSLFVDAVGNDVVRTGDFSGGAADGGAAFWLDAGGDDLYAFGSRALGWGERDGLALARDLGGDDDVLAGPRSMGVGRGGVGLFALEGGADQWVGGFGGRGRGRDGGLYLFLHLADRAAGGPTPSVSGSLPGTPSDGEQR